MLFLKGDSNSKHFSFLHPTPAINFSRIFHPPARSNCSNQEQLSLVIRFVDGSGEIREEFLGFLYCKLGLSGEALAETVLNGIANLTLDIHSCRGQGYDGVSSVSSYINGLSAQILRINEKAIYTHCHSHRLVVAASCNIQVVRNVLDHMKELSYFFN